MVDKLVAMKTFVRIVEAGSLTAAADSLDTSLPTVVRTLAALERNLGVSLLKRTTRRLHLTDEGSQYLERCRDILAATQEAEDILVARRTEPVGKLSVTASGAVRAALSCPDFVRLPPAQPQGQRRCAVRRSRREPYRGRHGCCDSYRPSQGFVARGPVGQVRRVVCASERYLRRHGVPQVPNDVRDHICVRHVGLVPRSDWHFRVGNRQVSVPITSVVTCNEIDSAVNACIDGLGLGMFLSYMVAPYRKDGQLKYILEKFETEPIPVQVVYPQARLMSNKVRAFIDECVGKLRRTRLD